MDTLPFWARQQQQGLKVWNTEKYEYLLLKIYIIKVEGDLKFVQQCNGVNYLEDVEEFVRPAEEVNLASWNIKHVWEERVILAITLAALIPPENKSKGLTTDGHIEEAGSKSESRHSHTTSFIFMLTSDLYWWYKLIDMSYLSCNEECTDETAAHTELGFGEGGGISAHNIIY